jgi:NADPH-ferrihemoprotein reductase
LLQKHPGGRISIYYATQTGTAESFAQQLEREGADHGFYIHVVDMEETSLEEMMTLSAYGPNEDETNNHNHPRAIILASTYGEGEPTDNATVMVNSCKEILEENNHKQQPLQNLEYTVFGLGNREYELFNAMGKYFDATFEQLGGTRIYELGLGDDNDDLEADFEKWKDGLWKCLEQKYLNSAEQQQALQKQQEAKSSEPAMPECEYEIEWHTHTAKHANNDNSYKPLDKIHGSSRHYFTAVDCPVSLVRELQSTDSEYGSTVHVELDLTKAKPVTDTTAAHESLKAIKEYQTADNLGVLPCNSNAVVESVAKSLGYDLDGVFSLKPATHHGNTHEWHGDPFPMPISVRECLTRYLDLTSAPRRSDLKLLSLYASDAVDRRALQRLSSKEGKADYKEKIMNSYTGLVELLKLCPSLEIPLEHLISLCHFALPRFYTISSSNIVYPDSIHLTVAVTQEKRVDGTFFVGVCSTHIAKSSQPSCNPQQSLRIFVRPSTFRLPKDPSTPIIMIGPGTGIAPMRALLQQRRHQQMVEKMSTGSNILYFGCKRKDQDYLYEDELKRFQDEGVLSELHLAFSRQTTKKVYVQHLLKQQAVSTWKMLNESGAYVYVCGGVKMGHDVTETLKEIATEQGEMSFDQAASYVSQLSGEGRYIQELWS